jgi:hypothetical protein
LRSKTFAQAEFTSAEQVDCPSGPSGCPHPLGVADADIQSILETLKNDLGAVLR